VALRRAKFHNVGVLAGNVAADLVIRRMPSGDEVSTRPRGSQRDGWPRLNAGANTQSRLLPGPAPAETKRAWRTLGQAVVLPRVRGRLNLGHGLSLCRVEVI
jgi:hypothetical protein